MPLNATVNTITNAINYQNLYNPYKPPNLAQAYICKYLKGFVFFQCGIKFVNLKCICNDNTKRLINNRKSSDPGHMLSEYNVK